MLIEVFEGRHVSFRFWDLKKVPEAALGLD